MEEPNLSVDDAGNVIQLETPDGRKVEVPREIKIPDPDDAFKNTKLLRYVIQDKFGALAHSGESASWWAFSRSYEWLNGWIPKLTEATQFRFRLFWHGMWLHSIHYVQLNELVIPRDANGEACNFLPDANGDVMAVPMLAIEQRNRVAYAATIWAWAQFRRDGHPLLGKLSAEDFQLAYDEMQDGDFQQEVLDAEQAYFDDVANYLTIIAPESENFDRFRRRGDDTDIVQAMRVIKTGKWSGAKIVDDEGNIVQVPVKSHDEPGAIMQDSKGNLYGRTEKGPIVNLTKQRAKAERLARKAGH